MTPHAILATGQTHMPGFDAGGVPGSATGAGRHREEGAPEVAHDAVGQLHLGRQAGGALWASPARRATSMPYAGTTLPGPATGGVTPPALLQLFTHGVADVNVRYMQVMHRPSVHSACAERRILLAHNLTDYLCTGFCKCHQVLA